MPSTLKELTAKRQSLIETLESNDFAEGIHKLLTDIYPDSAHFVYELLQNAEDVEATSVEFDLGNEGVYFAHNGKRPFTIEDIDAITSIGANIGKKNDSTSIGEFGVGFKAVFSYTATPEIHSGDYHFSIHDYFVPQAIAAASSNVRHTPSEGWTEFYFPFNNPEKPAEKAYAETFAGLKKLDESSLLFLNSIQSIRFSTRGKSALTGSISREHVDEQVIIITRASDGSSETSAFLRLIRPIEFVSDRKKKKTLPVGVAFALSEENGAKSISAIQGRTSIYFPAEKERSNLRFHINGPFSATASRDSIRDCDDNKVVISHIATLVSDSLEIIKQRGLLTTAAYAAMPNSEDELDPIYEPIRASVLAAFTEMPLLVGRNGSFLRASDALLGQRVFTDFGTDEILEKFAVTKKRWISGPRPGNRREELFLKSLQIEEFSEASFAKAFNKASQRDWLLSHEAKTDTTRLKAFYTVLCAVHAAHIRGDRGSDYTSIRAFSDFATNLKGSNFIYCLDGSMRSPQSTYFQPEGFAASDIQDPLVAPILLEQKSKTRTYDPAVFRKLLEDFGVSEYSIRVELERLLQKYANKVDPKDRDYYRDIMTIVRAHKRGIDLDFSNIRLFMATSQAGKTNVHRAQDVVIGKAYGNQLGDEVARFMGMPVLHEIYGKLYRSEGEGYRPGEAEDFIEFLEWCGAKTSLSIESSPIGLNPECNKLLKGKPISNKSLSVDYTIKGLPQALDGISYQLALELWRLISKSGTTSKYATAWYKASTRSTQESGDSALVIHLKSGSWLPDSAGIMHRPGEIPFQQLDMQFQEIGEGYIVNALELGSDISELKQAERKLEADATKIGKHVVSEDEYAIILKFRERERKAAERESKKNASRSAQEIFDSQERVGKIPADDDAFFEVGAVSNPERRAMKIEQTIRDSQSLPPVKRTAFSTVYASSEDERENLRQLYNGKCQICGTIITKANGDRYFEAINIINTKNLPDAARNSMSLGWNSLSLCPNCAARYMHSSKSISDLPAQIANTEVIPGDSEPIALEIELDGRTRAIEFAPKHFLALKKGVELLDE